MARCLLAFALILSLVSARAVYFERADLQLSRDKDELPSCALQCYNHIACSDAESMKACIGRTCLDEDDLDDAMDFLEDDCDDKAFDDKVKRYEIQSNDDIRALFGEDDVDNLLIASQLAARSAERDHQSLRDIEDMNDLPHPCATSCMGSVGSQFEQLGCPADFATGLSCLCNTANYYYGVHDCIMESCPADAQEHGLIFSYDMCEFVRSNSNQADTTNKTDDNDLFDEGEEHNDSEEEDEGDDEGDSQGSSGEISDEKLEERSPGSPPVRPCNSVKSCFGFSEDPHDFRSRTSEQVDDSFSMELKRQGVAEDISPPGEWAEGASSHYQGVFGVAVVSMKGLNDSIPPKQNNVVRHGERVAVRDLEGRVFPPTNKTNAPPAKVSASGPQMRSVQEVVLSPTVNGRFFPMTTMDYTIEARETDPVPFPTLVPRLLTDIDLVPVSVGEDDGAADLHARQQDDVEKDFMQTPEEWGNTPPSMCKTESLLKLVLADSKLFDEIGRRGYIAENGQLQFDSPPQTGAVYTSGFNVVGGTIALGPKNIFYACASGSFFNIYGWSVAGYCEPVLLRVVNFTENCSTEKQRRGMDPTEFNEWRVSVWPSQVRRAEETGPCRE